MKKIFPSIQKLRGVLFLLILAFHCGVPYAEIGWGGVESFFVISAFFLTRRYYLENNSINVQLQFKHRLMRLYPPYIVILVVATLSAIARKIIPLDLPLHLLSIQNLYWEFTGYTSALQPMTAHTWTLSIEIWTGLFIMILLYYMNKKQFKNFIYVMLVIGIFFRIVSITCGMSALMISLCPLAHFDAFACGSILAIRFKQNKLDEKVVLSLLTISLLGIVGVISYIAHLNNLSFVNAYRLLNSSENYLNNVWTGNIYLFLSLLTASVIDLLIYIDQNRKKKIGIIEKYLILLGNNSYVLYLFHWPVRVVFKMFIKHWSLLFGLTLLTSVIATHFYNYGYEKLQKKFIGKEIK